MRLLSMKAVAVSLVCFLGVAACAAAANEKQNVKMDKLNLTVDGFSRDYEVYVPSSIVRGSSRAYPALLVLHGGGPLTENVTKLGFNELAERDGVYIVYPKAYKQRFAVFHMGWNDGRGTTDSAKRGVDDVKFLSTLIRTLPSKYKIDKGRVFLTGASNGGLMTYRMGCQASGLLAGIAPVIGNVPVPIVSSCAPRTSLTFVSINGVEDPLMPYDGGEVCSAQNLPRCYGGFVESADESLRIFAKASGADLGSMKLTELAQIVDDGTKVVKHSFSRPQGLSVTAYEVQGMGHAWPPFKPQLPISGATSKNLSATMIIWNHFGLARKRF